MDEALKLIDDQRSQLKKKDEYTGLGSALMVCSATLVYLYIIHRRKK